MQQKWLIVTNSRWYHWQNKRKSHIANKKFAACAKKKKKNLSFKSYQKTRIHFYYTHKYRGVAYNISNLKQNCQKLPLILHNGSNFDYYFIIRELAEKFEDNT